MASIPDRAHAAAGQAGAAEAGESRWPARSHVLALLSCIRYREALVLQGAPLMGLAFSIGPITAPKLGATLLFAVASFFLVAHIWSLNDWAGFSWDRNDPNRSKTVFSTRGVSAHDILRLSLGLLGLSLLAFTAFSRITWLLAVAIAVLGVFYSHPALHAKSIPVLSSMTHLVGGVLHFLLGYSVFAPIDRRGILIALFFALTFTAGHLNQEVRDYEGDRLNGLATNAVAFGPRAAFVAGLAVFTLAYGDLLLLAVAAIVPAALGILAVALYSVHLYWSLATLRAGLTFERVSGFQRRYRLLYAVIGLAIGAALVLR